MDPLLQVSCLEWAGSTRVWNFEFQMPRSETGAGLRDVLEMFENQAIQRFWTIGEFQESMRLMSRREASLDDSSRSRPRKAELSGRGRKGEFADNFFDDVLQGKSPRSHRIRPDKTDALPVLLEKGQLRERQPFPPECNRTVESCSSRWASVRLPQASLSDARQYPHQLIERLTAGG